MALPKIYKQAAFKEKGGALVLEEVELQHPGRGELLVKVEACGICFSDVFAQENGMGAGFPVVPGHEIIGHVAEIGEDVSAWKIGDRVGAGWHGGHDGTCNACKQGYFQMCDNEMVHGMTRRGGYAEYATIRAESAAHIPDGVDSAKYAPILCAGLTVFNGIRHMGVGPGDTVAIQGLGGLGHLAVQYANRMGFRVVAVSRGSSKEAFARKLGAHEYINTEAVADAGAALKELGGAKLVVATSPSGQGITSLIKGLGVLGKLLIISLPGEIPIDTMALLKYGLSVQVWPFGHATDAEDALRFTQLENVDCMVETFPFSRVNDAFNAMRNGTVRFRAVVTMEYTSITTGSSRIDHRLEDASILMSASHPVLMEPGDGPVPNEAIRRTAVNELPDRNSTITRGTTEAYLSWPNEAGFESLDEHRGPIRLKVKGDIPSWAAGSLFRTGPGLNKIENTTKGTIQLSHWFDGLAHTHRFDIVPDPSTHRTEVSYSSRRQCDDFVEHVRKHGLDDMITFAQKADPCVGIFGKFVSSWRASNDDRGTKKLENAGVTVQLEVPGLSPPSDTKDGQLPRQTAWLGTDANFLREINPQTLEPIGFAKQTDLHPGLDGPLSCAHAQRCPVTGDYFNVNIKGGRKATYKVFRTSAATGKTEILAEISNSDVPMAYIHSFYLSRHFVMLRVPSSHISYYGMGILWKKNLLDSMEPFSSEKTCKWFIIDRHHGRGILAKFETEAAFFFHTVNCFEEATSQNNGPRVTLTIDTVEYPNTDILYAMQYDVLLNRDGKAKSVWGTEENARAVLPWLVRRKIVGILVPEGPEPSLSWAAYLRWKCVGMGWMARQSAEQVAIKFRRLSPQLLAWLRFANDRPLARYPALLVGNINIPAPHVGELPTINPDYHTKPYRYVYSLSMGCRSTFVDTIVKTDLVTRDTLQWNNPHGHTPGEAIFVARPGTDEEDDGVLLSVVLDGNCKKSYLLCLDARTMTERGRAEMDFAVGFGFHGVHTNQK